jgi:KDO2-lipid IV(A) lauroyltransferase
MNAALVHPRYWPAWFGIAILRALSLLPYPWLLRLGRGLGRLLLPIAGQRARIARRNLERCFPETDQVQREQLLKRHFESIGISALEIPLAWWAPAERIAPLADIEGLENLRAAADAGKGVLLLSAHFTCLEIGGRLLARHFPFHAMYRPASDPVVDYLMANGRRRTCETIIPRDAPKTMIRSLRGGHAVWYAPDQNTQRKKSVFVRFFGHQASTTPATAKLATLTGARVVPFKAVRKRDGSGYRLVLEPALEDFPSGDVERDTQRINDIIERWVREDPDQYLWIHRRFRTRPNADDPPFY